MDPPQCSSFILYAANIALLSHAPNYIDVHSLLSPSNMYSDGLFVVQSVSIEGMVAKRMRGAADELSTTYIGTRFIVPTSNICERYISFVDMINWNNIRISRVLRDLRGVRELL